MNKSLKFITISISVISVIYFAFYFGKRINLNSKRDIGEVLDSLNGVYVYYNGGVSHTGERTLSEDGYNIGLKYQCVEFVKRYYYNFYHHKMPDSYGNAKDFFDKSVSDGKINTKRNLIQFTNPSSTKPQIGDLIIFDGHFGNKYGHVAIISMVTNSQIQIIQQNPGPFANSREYFPLDSNSKGFSITDSKVLGRLRMSDGH